MNGTLNFMRFFMFVTICACILAACNPLFQKHLREEVRLADGTVLIDERGYTVQKYGEWSGSGGWEPPYMTLEIISSDLSDPPGKWEFAETFIPILFDRRPTTKEWTIIASEARKER